MDRTHSDWRPAPDLADATPPQLAGNDVHVWLFGLDAGPSVAQALDGVLDTAQRARLQRLRDPRHRFRYTVAQGMLRRILGLYGQCPPDAFTLERGPRGKPYLPESSGLAWLRFNLSHSGDQALVAVSRGREVGVDLESLNRVFDPLALAKRFFTPGETAHLNALSQAQRREAFLLAWTRKEALVKAMGCGIMGSLAHIEVSVAPGAPPAWLRSFQPEDLARWDLRALPPIDGYAAALAAEGSGWTIRCYRIG